MQSLTYFLANVALESNPCYTSIFVYVLDICLYLYWWYFVIIYTYYL